MGLHQFIHLQGTGVAGWLPFPDVLVKVVGVEGTEQTAARPGLQPPHLPVVGVAHGAGPAHLYQRVAGFKKR